MSFLYVCVVHTIFNKLLFKQREYFASKMRSFFCFRADLYSEVGRGMLKTDLLPHAFPFRGLDTF